MTYAEKSAGASFVAYAAGLIVYLSTVQDAEHVRAVVPALIAMAILAAMIQTVAHIGFRFVDRSEEEDERDRTIALLGTRNGEGVLAVGVWGIVALAVMQAPPLLIANAALVNFTLAELLRSGTRLYYYRRGL